MRKTTAKVGLRLQLVRAIQWHDIDLTFDWIKKTSFFFSILLLINQAIPIHWISHWVLSKILGFTTFSKETWPFQSWSVPLGILGFCCRVSHCQGKISTATFSVAGVKSLVGLKVIPNFGGEELDSVGGIQSYFKSKSSFLALSWNIANQARCYH